MHLAFLVLALALASCARLPSSPEGRRGLFDLGNDDRAIREYALRQQDSSCRPLSRTQREELLALANPLHFEGVKYREGGRNLASAIDCSHFVHEIYRKAGLPYAFRSSRELRDAPEFELLPESEALPGDLMLFRGHVGIVDEDGLILSATRIRSPAQKSSITRYPREHFAGFRGRRYVLRYRCQPKEHNDLAISPRVN